MDFTEFVANCIRQWGGLDFSITLDAAPRLAEGLLTTIKLSGDKPSPWYLLRHSIGIGAGF